MAWSSGVYTKGNSATGGWTGDAAGGIGIEAGRHDTQDNDFATGINTCLTKDGQNNPTANLPMAGFKHTGVANGSANTDYMAYGQIRNGTPLYMDTTNNRLGIGTSTPVTRLEVAETTNATNIVTMSNSSNGATATSAIYFKNDTSSPASFIVQNSSGNTTLGGAGSMNIGTNGATPVTIIANGAQRAFFASGGNIGLGSNNAPAVFIDAQRDANDSLTRFRLYNASSGSSAQTNIDFGNNTNQSAVTFFLNSSANTANAGANAFHIFNGLTAPIRMRAGASGGVDLASGATSWAAVSDSRLKKNIIPLSYGLAEVLQLTPVKYDYVVDESDSSNRMGFIAQDVKPVIPEAVTGSEETFYGLSATELIPALVNAIKQLEARVAELEK